MDRNKGSISNIKSIYKIWWPLAFSWLLMAVEMPALSAVVARLPNAEINLAAYGGIVFPFSLIIEAPIIMLLAASTALSADWQAYLKIRRFMLVSGAILTAVHILLAFTPLYDWMVTRIIGAPAEIIEPGRIGLQLMTPWTWSIAYRRFQQGVMIRFGHSGGVGTGTIVRLLADGIVLFIGYNLAAYVSPWITGVMVGAAAQAVGVMSEAAYSGLRVRPILRDELRPVKSREVLTWKAFYDFYIPLALNSLLFLIWQPIGSAALSRMPMAIESLAAWQVLSSLTFVLRSFGFAYNEVVVAALRYPESYPALKRFTTLLARTTTGLHLLFAGTPLADFWFSGISALPSALAAIAQVGFWLALPLPALSVWLSWYQGAIVFSQKTRPIPESVVVFLVTVLVVLLGGVFWGRVAGLYIGMGAFVLANATQMFWLRLRGRNVMLDLSSRVPVTQPAD